MGRSESHDGASVNALRWGSGRPLVVVPGGPDRDAEYLADLGGLAPRIDRSIAVLEPRGTGGSPSADEYSVERTAEVLEAFLARLELDRMDLLAHSAGCEVALAYAANHLRRIERLLLVTPSTRRARH
ncbi:alpha/beta fold hydrolase [Agromyces sp. CFH 90414]|uniref:Alpha/beta fold hydrolase n=1 Tax=Agromyces agglutinans TaxID=2662258 RepID=A0A6I2F9S7_9MICO|nr:alpha/beta hydrolase [Agromyces agglutinans]MRG58763.1 alpha/beta fold hydrolase [Agromyces agglutinans]